MKLRYIFASLVAVAALATSCQEENPLGTLEGISADKDVIIMPVKGGTATVKVTSTAAWEIDEKAIPACLTVSPTKGEAGETSVSFTSVPVKNSVFADIKISCGGKFKFLVFSQSADPDLQFKMKAGKYYILAKKGEKWTAAKALGLEIDNSGSYGYMNVDEIEAKPEDGFAGLSEATYAFTFEEADAAKGLYYIKTPDGAYLYQDAAGKYNNFYLSSTTDKAFKWTVDEISDTEYEIKSEQGKWFQFTSYGNYGAYNSKQDKATLPLIVAVK